MADVPTRRYVAHPSVCCAVVLPRCCRRGPLHSGRLSRVELSGCETSLARLAVRRALVMSHGPVRPDGGAQTNTTAVLQSIDVTEAYRALFRETYKGDQAIIVFHLIGTHKELYGL